MGNDFAALSAVLNEFLAPLQERPERLARCPKCGGRLLASVSVYPHTAVVIREWGDGTRHAMHHHKIVETKTTLDDEAAENYGRVDEREDLYCERFNRDGGCDYWCHVLDLEFPAKEGT